MNLFGSPEQINLTTVVQIQRIRPPRITDEIQRDIASYTQPLVYAICPCRIVFIIPAGNTTILELIAERRFELDIKTGKIIKADPDIRVNGHGGFRIAFHPEFTIRLEMFFRFIANGLGLFITRVPINPRLQRQSGIETRQEVAAAFHIGTKFCLERGIDRNFNRYTERGEYK